MKSFKDGSSKFFLITILFSVSIGVLGSCRNSQQQMIHSRVMQSGVGGQFLRNIWLDSARGSATKTFLAVVIFFDDLGCLPCLNSFLALSDSLREKDDVQKDVMLVFARTRDTYWLQRRRFEEWCGAHNLTFPMFLIISDSLRHNMFEHTSAVLVGPAGKMELCEPIPLSEEVIQQIMIRLRQ